MSRYTNYVMKNNVFAELYAPISSLATTIQLKSGQGARWGTDFPILATLENIDSTGKVQKREIVKITARSGDYLTVVRGFVACPANDDANSQGTTTFSFGADDRINMYVPKEIFDKIGNTLNDIYENGLDKLRVDVVSGLQIHVGAGPILVGSAYYDFAGDNITLTDNATNYVEIDKDGYLVANTSAWGSKNAKIAKVTTSSWVVTNIEDRRLGTVWGEVWGVNIHELTAKTTLVDADEMVVSDSEAIWNNKKVTVKNLAKYVKQDIEYNAVAGRAFFEFTYWANGSASWQSGEHTISKTGTYTITMMFTSYGGRTVDAWLSVNGTNTLQSFWPVMWGNHNAPVYACFDINLTSWDVIKFVWSAVNNLWLNRAELTYAKDYILS